MNDKRKRDALVMQSSVSTHAILEEEDRVYHVAATEESHVEAVEAQRWEDDGGPC